VALNAYIHAGDRNTLERRPGNWRIDLMDP
jgi:hypothetical protein